MEKLSPEVRRERERAMRMEDTLKRAVKVANRYKSEYEKLKKENSEMKKELSSAVKWQKRAAKRFTDADGIPGFLASLDSNTFFQFRNTVRKSLHPDKHTKLSGKTKKAVSDFFILMEDILG